MKLSFSTRGWPELSWEEMMETALDMGFSGIEVYNLPKFPAVKRDLALIVDEKLTCGEIEEVLLHSCKYVTATKLFDVYRGGQLPEGKKSMAFTLTFTPDATAEKAFTPENLDGFVKKILGNLKFKLGIELR